jgi:hypothetical protein
MFIGTRRRKTIRKEPEYLRPPSAVRHGPRIKSGVTGTEGARICPAFFHHPSPCAGTSRGQRPLPQRGKRLYLWERLVAAMPGFIRPHSRHSALDHSLPRSAVRAFSVIPDLIRACPGPDPGNPCSSKRDGGSVAGRVKISPATFSPSTWTPGLRPGCIYAIGLFLKMNVEHRTLNVQHRMKKTRSAKTPMSNFE